MSAKHPIISVTGSSGAGTTMVRETFDQIFRRENVRASFIGGDAFHRFDREEMRRRTDEAEENGQYGFSHFGAEANLFDELEATFRGYGETGTARFRHYIHDAKEAEEHGTPEGTFTPWQDIEPGNDILFYEGLHGAVKTERVDVGRYADLKIGVVPVINLEWIQKLHRDKDARGYSTADVTQTILRRMPDYVKYIVPQFSETDINFQRVPMVDTSNPFVARNIPTADETMVVIRFKNPRGIDFSYLLSMISGSVMSRANCIVIPGGRLDLAMQLILTPIIMQLVERRRRVV